MNDHLKAHRDFQQVMDDSMVSFVRRFKLGYNNGKNKWLILILILLSLRNIGRFPFATMMMMTSILLLHKRFSSTITPDLPKSKSLIIEDEHLDTIPETESDELIKFSVEDLVHTPSESDGISKGECDLPVCDDSSPKKDEVLDDIISIPPRNGNDHFNAESSPIESVLNRDNVISSPKIDLLIEEFAGELALIAPIPHSKEDIRFIENLMYDNSFSRPLETLKDDSETVIDSNNDYSSSDDDSYEDIDYVDASPPDSELVSLEVVEIVIPEVGGIDTDILLTIKDDILREKLLNVNLLIAKIEALKDNPTPSSSSDFVTKSDFYHEEFAGELAHIISPSEYDHFYFKIEPDSGNFTMDVVEDIFDNPTREPRVHVPNVLPTIPPFIWIQISLFLVIPSDPTLQFLFLPELETRFSIQGYSLESNP
ncbi:hypothetical protein Tco_0830498 [Tanacetum coccineum]